MDRAKELRQMMKSAGRKDEPTGGGGLTGKDKLKMMRDLKQQKSETAAPPAPVRSMSKPASAPIKTIDPKDTKFMEEWKKSSSILPAGFFDGGVSKAQTVAKPVVPPAPAPKPISPAAVSVPSTSSNKSASTKTYTAAAVPPPASSVANVPLEFFDNARE